MVGIEEGRGTDFPGIVVEEAEEEVAVLAEAIVQVAEVGDRVVAGVVGRDAGGRWRDWVLRNGVGLSSVAGRG